MIWLDVPADQLVERLRAARREDIGIEGDLRTFVADHLATFTPYYFAGVRVDGSGSIADTIAAVMPHLAPAPDSGTLVLRADIHGGLIELGEGILSPSLAHVLERLAARRCVILTSPRTRARAEEAAMVVRGVAACPSTSRSSRTARRPRPWMQQELPVPSARRPPDGAPRSARGHR